jgi:putative transposase
VTFEAVRPWSGKFGQGCANQLRRQRPKPTNKRQLDKVFLTVLGERHSLWRAVAQDGHAFDTLEQHRRNQRTAKEYFRKLIEGLAWVPSVIITDKLTSYEVAQREGLPAQSPLPLTWFEICYSVRLVID